MGKGKKLIILLAVVVLLVGGLFAVKHFLSDEEETPEEQDESIPVGAMQTDDVVGVLYVSGKDSISLVRREDTWFLENDEEFPVNQAYAATMAADAAELTARRLVSESADDFVQYGLESPPTAYVFTLTDGTQVTYYIGNHNTYGDTYYLNVAGTEKIYLIDADFLEDFRYTLSELADVGEIEKASTDQVTAMQLTLDGTTTELFYKEKGLPSVYSNAFTWFLDRSTPADESTAKDFIGDAVNYTSLGCAAYNADEKQLAAFGLDDPVLSLRLDYTVTTEKDTGEVDDDDQPIKEDVKEKKTLTFFVGGTADDGSYYAKLAGSDVAYKIAPEYMETLRGFDLDTLRSWDVCLVALEDVVSMEVTADGKKSVLKIDRDGDKTTYMLDDAKITQALFDDFFSSIHDMKSEGTTDKTTDGKSTLTVVYHTTRKGFETIRLAFTPFDQNFYVTQLGDRSGVLVNRRDVEAVKSAFASLKKS